MSEEKQSQAKESAKSDNGKKPLYKKWWFWVIIVIILIGIGGASSSDDEPKKVGENGSSSEQAPAEEKKDFKVGDVISRKGVEISVTSVERNYAPDNTLAELKDGMEFVKVNLNYTNNSDNIISYNAFDWKIQDGNGTIEDYSDAMFAQANDKLDSGELAKGGKKSGSLVFQVPKDDDKLILHYQASFWSNETIQIKL